MRRDGLQPWQFSLSALFAAVTIAAVIAALGRYEAITVIAIAILFLAVIFGITFRLVWTILRGLRCIALRLLRKS